MLHIILLSYLGSQSFLLFWSAGHWRTLSIQANSPKSSSVWRCTWFRRRWKEWILLRVWPLRWYRRQREEPPALRWEDKPHTCMTCIRHHQKQDRFSLKPGLLIYDHIVVTHYNNVPLFNRIIHLKMKILSSFANPQVVLNLEFLSSVEHKRRYFKESW